MVAFARLLSYWEKINRRSFFKPLNDLAAHFNGIPYKFPLGQVFDKGIKLAFGQAPVQKYIDELIRLIEQSKVKLDDIVTHRLPLEKAPHAYDIFSEKKDGCVKVVLKPAISENNGKL